MISILAQTGVDEFAWKALQVLLQSAISGVIVGLVAWGAMKANMANVRKRQEDHDRLIAEQGRAIAALRAERAECELRASRSYATSEEVNQVFEKLDKIGERMGERMDEFRREMHDDVQAVHTRITEVATRVAAFQGEGE
jgi:uncharacterized membrane protein